MTFLLAYKDYLLDDVIDGNTGTIMRDGKFRVNLKCEPMSTYHMNKKHWNTVTVGSDVSADGLF